MELYLYSLIHLHNLQWDSLPGIQANIRSHDVPDMKECVKHVTGRFYYKSYVYALDTLERSRDEDVNCARG